MAYTAPGKHFRKGLSVKGFFALFPDDATAEQWFIEASLAERYRLPLLRFG